jgi:predicted RNase H-like HicB family nuclease
MYRFAVEVEETKGGYTVSVPALPGCVISRKSREEALEEVRHVIGTTLVQYVGIGWPLPQVKTVPSSGRGMEYVEVALPPLQPC